MPSNPKKVLKDLKKLAEEVEELGPEFYFATTNRTPEGKLTMAFVEPFDG